MERSDKSKEVNHQVADEKPHTCGRRNGAGSLRSNISNIVVVELMQVPIVMVFSVAIPSLYKFVIGSPDIYRGANATAESSIQQWPGLGETESFYSWIATAYSLGALVIAPVAGQMPRLIGYRLSVIFACLFLAGGGLLYSFATNGWMVFAARFFIGLFDGCAYVFTYSYISLIGMELELEKSNKKAINLDSGSDSTEININSKSFKSTLKDKLFSINLMIKSITYPVTFAITTIMVQFKEVDQYRWPGFFIAVLGVVYCGMFLLLFRSHSNPPTTSNKKATLAPEKSAKVKMCSPSCEVCQTFSCRRVNLPTLKEILTYAVIISAGYIVGSVFILIDTFLTPILSDNFGFTVEDTSYFFLGAMFLPFVATFLLFVLKAVKVSNRAILLLCILATLTGSLLSSDWQSLGLDPCQHTFSTTHQSINLTIIPRDNTSVNDTTNKDLHNGFDEYSFHELSFTTTINNSLLLADHCTGLSTTEHACYWNPVSRVTGKLCIECYQTCRSKQKSINFIQFCVGFSFILSVSQLFLTSVYSVASDYTPKVYQGTVISFITLGVGVARTVTPLWAERIYQLFERRTLPPLAVFSGKLFALLLSVLAIYKELTYKHFTSGKKTDVRLEVTNPTYLETDVRDISK